MPKAPAKDAGSIKPKMRPDTFTLHKLLTADETKTFYVSFLKDQANKKGPWREYFDFYKNNQSGDVESMSPDVRKYVEKMVKDIQDKYAEVMG